MIPASGAPGGAPPGGGPAAPAWLERLAAAAAVMAVPAGMAPPPAGGRRSAVLILFGEAAAGPDVLLVQRSPFLRRHAGQPAFPGGAIEPQDGGPEAAALREAAEEALVDPAGVDVLAVLPDLYIPRSGFAVTPVLAWWRRPGPVGPGDGEVTAVRRIPVAELADPANRRRVQYPEGRTGPAFQAGGMLIWGFTGAVVDRLLALGGWAVPWDSAQVIPPPPGAMPPPGGAPAPGPRAAPDDPGASARPQR
jgi:8-oxo-dGTP pyrophosphatase MutT (NUDIX family)